MGAVCSCCPCCKPKVVKPAVPTKYEVPQRPNVNVTQQYSPRQGFTSIGITKNDPLLLIRGFEKEPLVSLEEALQPFDGEIDQLSYHIKEAKKNCKQPSEHGLTRDEAAAIYIYTKNWSDGCLYNHLDRAWKSKDPARMTRWFKFLRLFKAGYDKLPNAPKKIWQGGPYDESVKNQLSSSVDPLYSAMCLCSLSETEVREYLNKHGSIKMMLIAYAAQMGKLAVGYTADSSNSVVLWPGLKLGVSDVQVIDPNGSVTLHITKKSEYETIIKPEPTFKPEPHKPKKVEKHFVCRNAVCGYHCRGDHREDRCNGFQRLNHECQHHCGPVLECYNCGQNFHQLYECKICQKRFCDRCCLINIALNKRS